MRSRRMKRWDDASTTFSPICAITSRRLIIIAEAQPASQRITAIALIAHRPRSVLAPILHLIRYQKQYENYQKVPPPSRLAALAVLAVLVPHTHLQGCRVPVPESDPISTNRPLLLGKSRSPFIPPL